MPKSAQPKTTKAAEPMSETVIKTPDAKPIHESFALILREAQQLEVKDKASHGRAGEVLVDLKRAVKVLCEGNGNDWEGFDEPCSAADKAHKFLTKLRKLALTPYEQMIAAVNRRMTDYEVEAQRKADEEQRRLAAIAKEQEEERMLLEAIEAESQGDTVASEEILAQPVEAAAVAVAPQVAKTDGLSGHWNYKAEIQDLMSLVRWVALHPEDVGYLEVNQPAINERARSQKDAFFLAGCKLVKEKVRTVRT